MASKTQCCKGKSRLKASELTTEVKFYHVSNSNLNAISGGTRSTRILYNTVYAKITQKNGLTMVNDTNAKRTITIIVECPYFIGLTAQDQMSIADDIISIDTIYDKDYKKQSYVITGIVIEKKI